MRLFIAVPLPVAVIHELSAISLRLRSDRDGLRWSASESWHITLQFLGNSSREQYEWTVARLREVRAAAVPIALEGLDFFNRAGVLFAGVRVTRELLLLQERVAAATQLCGFVLEARAYQPHITLARSIGKGQSQGLLRLTGKMPREPQFTSFVAEEFLLYESFLGPAGVRHEVRARFSFIGR